MRAAAVMTLITVMAAQAGERVASSGKAETVLADVPLAVLVAAAAARPDLHIKEAEYETRDGREYYDVGGTLPDGSELELDLMLTQDGWQVVEVQRDIDLSETPPPVSQALASHVPGWAPQRIIESDQGDGVIIYEFFGPGDPETRQKIEVKWEAEQAEVLSDEWAH